MTGDTVDTVILGGGLAGLVIARELSAAGRTVTLLEARSRLGGRVYYDNFEGTEHFVELGGNWVAPSYQPLVAAEIDRYGLGLIASEPGLQSRSISLGRMLYGNMPVPADDFVDLERAVWECLASSRRIEYGRPWEEQGLEDLDVSWAEYVRGLGLSPAVEEYLMNWSSAALPEEVSALNILVLFATFGHSAWAAYNSMEHKFEGGMASLVHAITSDVRAEIHLEVVVARVEQFDERVDVTTTDGRTFSGRTAVLALPVNCWADVEFEPPLSTAKRQVALAKHAGVGQKLWLQLENMPDGGLFGCGSGQMLTWLMRDRELKGEGDLYVAFTGGRRVDVTDLEGVQEMVRVYAPDAKLVRVAEHNWTADEYAKGVWAVFRPGHFTEFHTSLSEPEQRLYFAGSDLSFGQQLWIEGALESAFQVVDRLLGRR